ncbi:golgin subfamily A member 2 [Zophobas morio]|uniref:golgin subfamily A member 2 n=1 Tax=Zophobas morio TaxID=2755281 RepID=UPI003083E005
MADVSKAQKLASARKKFKELKKEKKKNAQKVNDVADSPPTSREQTPVENVASVQDQTETQLPNYFNNVNYNNGYQQPVAFFDSFADTSVSESPLANAFGDLNDHEHVESNENHEDVVLGNESKDLVEEVVEDGVTVDNKNEEIADFHAFDTVKLESSRPTQLSSVESLRQISDQMAELINPTSENSSGVIESQLETRNQELATLLNQERVKSEHLAITLQEYQNKMSQMEAELRERDINSDTKFSQEMSSLREQLQCHIQTVGILVAEKTELVANLSQFQLAAKQKTSECEELQGRLKTSRSRVADLEREIVLLKNEKSQFDTLEREQSSELDTLKKTYQVLKDERDELMQDLLEVREKLKTSSENNLVFQQQIGELSNQLSLANIKIQQLTTGEMDHVSSQVHQLTQEKFALEKQVADLTHTVKTISKEREESSLQYQQYAQQLNSQITSMAGRLEKLQKENESLQVQEQNRIKHIGELEKQLQSLQNDHVNFAISRNVGDSRAELDAALELVEKLKSENAELQGDNVKVADEKELLLKDLEAQAESVRELEGLLEELRGNQPDTVKLLATMESDKVAAARAVAQNAELKSQMESMHEVFMKLNNDKIELTEKLTSEQRNNKDLFEKLQKTEVHLQTLADAIEIKDKELSHLRENSLQLDKQMLQSEQLTDRLRHYEAQDHSTQSLQNELQESKQTIANLTAEIEHLKHAEDETDAKTEATVDASEIDELKQKLENLEMKNRELENKLCVNDDQSPIDSNHNDQWTVLDREAAMKHLEAKFLKTMEDIANLTEEKQRLEHLVLQLQGETETIGEYVALYQYQRSLLKQKAIEKDQQLSQLATDREQMKNKLEKLNELVRKLVLEKGAVPPELWEHHDNLSRDNQLCEEHAKIHNEINKIAQNSFTVEPSNCDSNSSTETAEQIITLLSEIKSSNLVQPTENFQHCPWCSGKLITV